MAENFPELIRHQNTTPESFSGNQVEQIPKKHPPPKKNQTAENQRQRLESIWKKDR